jgi:pyruvate dehydrogenase E1 component alpha subunit
MPEKKTPLPPVLHLSVLDPAGKVDRTLLPELSTDRLLAVYRTMIRSRRLEESMLRRQRQGQMGTFAPAIGQEAAQVGAMAALTDRDWLVPSFREVPAALWRGASMRQVFLYTMGFEEGSEVPEGARVLPISIPVGSQTCHAAGLAWAMKLRGEDSLAISFFGEGATSEGAVHEAMNFAGVLRLPVIFLCQNNQWAISTPRAIQTAAQTIAQKAVAYGIPGVQVDGNDVFAVHRAVSEAAARARKGEGATLIEAVTWRRSVHTTADDPRVYRTEAQEKEWESKDPILRLRVFLQAEGHWDGAREEALAAEVEAEIAREFEAAVAYRDGDVDVLEMFDHVFAETPEFLRRQREEAARAIAGRRVLTGAGKAITKQGGAAAVGELEEAEETPSRSEEVAKAPAEQAEVVTDMEQAMVPGRTGGERLTPAQRRRQAEARTAPSAAEAEATRNGSGRDTR